jgi:hypothetical protein
MAACRCCTNANRRRVATRLRPLDVLARLCGVRVESQEPIVPRSDFAAILGPQAAAASWGQLLVMGVTLVALALVTPTLWAFFADCAHIMLRTPNDWLWRDRVSATIMIIAGVALAVTKR